MKHKNLIIGFVVLAVIVVLISLFFKGSGGSSQDGEVDLSNQVVSTEAPSDIVLDFYELWLNALHSTGTDPYQSGLATTPILSKKLSDKLVVAQAGSPDGVDPVLCQPTVPEKFRVKSIFELETNAQFLVQAARDKELIGQATVNLVKLNDGWYIDDIYCSSGEVAPVSEFSFEKEGFLLKSVPPPLDSQYWHLVFEENGKNGHTAPLFFNEESICTYFDGSEGVCDQGKFTDAIAASVKGDMTESGVNVRKLKILEDKG